tara:strand:+ start:87 stop:1796 length:1710 start_codon:yes stop_codon:yes gene_type:complete
MATLAEINQTLSLQNTTLKRVDDNTEDTSRGIGTFVKFLQDNKRKDLEAARETQKVIAPDVQPTVSDTGKGGGGGGILGGLRNALAAASLVKLGPMLAKGLAKRVLLPGAIAMFSDEIVDFLLPDGFENQAIRDALSGAISGGAIGFAVGGPLGGAIGAGIGALFKNEKFKKAIGELGTTLKEQAKVLYEKIEPTIINFKNAFIDFFNALGITKEGVTEGLAKFLQVVGDTAAAGVKQLTRLIKGDFDQDSIIGGLLTLSSVAALLLPGPFMKLMLALAGLAKGPGKFLLKLAKSPLKFLAPALGIFGLGSLATDTKMDGADKTKLKGQQTVGKPGSVVKSAKGNLMIAGADGKATAVKAPAGSKVGDMPKTTGISKIPSKFGRMLKFLRIPGVAQLMAVTDAFQVLSSDMPMNEKVKRMGGIFGGLLGSGGGALLGAALGSVFPGPGTVLGGLIGGMGGYFAGDYLGNKLASFLLGGDEKAISKPAGDDSMRMGRGGPTQTFKKPSITSGETIKDNVNRGMSPGAMGGSSIAFSADTNQTINNNSSTNALISSGPAVDLQDQMLASGT